MSVRHALLALLSDGPKYGMRTPPGPTAPPRDELVTKVLVATRVPRADPGEVIQAHRRQAVEIMRRVVVRQ